MAWLIVLVLIYLRCVTCFDPLCVIDRNSDKIKISETNQRLSVIENTSKSIEFYCVFHRNHTHAKAKLYHLFWDVTHLFWDVTLEVDGVDPLRQQKACRSTGCEHRVLLLNLNIKQSGKYKCPGLSPELSIILTVLPSGPGTFTETNLTFGGSTKIMSIRNQVRDFIFMPGGNATVQRPALKNPRCYVVLGPNGLKHLMIAGARPEDSGVYTALYDEYKKKSVYLNVSENTVSENAATSQRGCLALIVIAAIHVGAFNV